MAESRYRNPSKLQDTVPASTTKTVDTIPLSVFKSVEYIINLYDASGPRGKALKLRVDRVDISVIDQVYARAGDAINIGVNAVSIGSDMQLQFVNNELVPVDVIATRTIL